MARQLVLLDSTDTDWHLDEATRMAGKRGIAAARAALASVAGYRSDDADEHPTHLPAA
ncbi:MAG TPA: hypothetical protein VM938_04755 [Acidimicrobiales bacterium]|nr:hypothetical protein [Acidimicrobiales bacterium]